MSDLLGGGSDRSAERLIIGHAMSFDAHRSSMLPLTTPCFVALSWQYELRRRRHVMQRW